jgi:hypothetical protein
LKILLQKHVPPFAFLAKLVFTAVTLGTGFGGGEAIPLFFMGAALGNTDRFPFPICRYDNTTLFRKLYGITN